MLPRAFRLKRSKLFPKTLASGKTLCSNPYFVMLGLKRSYESPMPTKIGFVISKKISNRATVRNKMKRRLREIVRQEMVPTRMNKVSPFISIVIIARKDILEASYSDLQKSLVRCLESR
jgi:ribonuclease P protein component